MEDLQTLVVIIGAVALDLALGDPAGNWHPVAWLGRLIAAMVGLAPKGSNARLIWGLVLVVGGSTLVAGLLFLINLLLPAMNMIGLLLHILLLKLSFSLRGLRLAARRIRRALSSGQLDQARRWLQRDLVSRPTADLSSEQVAAAAIESLAENLTDSFTAPLLAYAIGGLPAVWVYRFINTADAMVGYRTAEYEHLGKASALIDDLLNLLPARLSAGFILLAAPIGQGSIRDAWRALLADRYVTASPNAGWTMAAAGGALGLQLEKAGHYTLNRYGRQPRPADLLRADSLLLGAAGLSVTAAVLVRGLIRAI